KEPKRVSQFLLNGHTHIAMYRNVRVLICLVPRGYRPISHYVAMTYHEDVRSFMVGEQFQLDAGDCSEYPCKFVLSNNTVPLQGLGARWPEDTTLSHPDGIEFIETR